MRKFKMMQAVVVAFTVVPKFLNEKGGKIAARVLQSMHNDEHEKVLAAIPENPTDEQWNTAIQGCADGKCETHSYLKGVNDYEELKEAARLLDQMRRDLSSAIESIRRRAMEIDPERFGAEQRLPSDLGAAIGELLTNIRANGYSVSTDGPFAKGSPKGMVS
jgi:hypothetical protein